MATGQVTPEECKALAESVLCTFTYPEKVIVIMHKQKRSEELDSAEKVLFKHLETIILQAARGNQLALNAFDHFLSEARELNENPEKLDTLLQTMKALKSDEVVENNNAGAAMFAQIATADENGPDEGVVYTEKDHNGKKPASTWHGPKSYGYVAKPRKVSKDFLEKYNLPNSFAEGYPPEK